MIEAKSLLKKSLLSKSLVESTSFREEPDYCHTFSSTGTLSQRMRAAAGAHLRWSSSEMVSRNTVRNRKKHARRKRKKQHDKLLVISIMEQMKSISARFSDEFLKENVVVFDGGIRREVTAKTKIQVPGWYCLRIDGGALDICTPPSKDMGLMYHDVHDNQPQFVLRDEGTPFTCRQYLFLSYPVVFYA